MNKKVITNYNIFPSSGYADPHVLVENGRLHLICGHDKSMYTETTWIMNRWDILSTKDLVNWTKHGEILPTDTYIGDKDQCWAGDLASKDGKYYWYFSNKFFDTGVMVSDSPTGPFKDALNKPLLPNDIIDGTPYDPCVYEEDGVYTLFFGSDIYYCATLGDDMISLASEPKAIDIFDKEGQVLIADDKITVFKREDTYYLVWGGEYAMSKQLLGPYVYQGESLAGGHNSVFLWNDQWYLISEMSDISIFYRGICLRPLNFNLDKTIQVPPNNVEPPIDGREWTFSHSNMGFHELNNTGVNWEGDSTTCGVIFGSILNETNSTVAIQSAIWQLTDLDVFNTLTIRLKNQTQASKARITLASIPSKHPSTGFWKTPDINWDDEAMIEFDILPTSDDFIEYSFDLGQVSHLKKFLKRIKIEPALDVKTGSWAINYISII